MHIQGFAIGVLVSLVWAAGVFAADPETMTYRIRFAEPTTQANGQPLTDLTTHVVEIQLDNDNKKGFTFSIDATDPAGGGTIDEQMTIPFPVPNDANAKVEVSVYSQNARGQRSEPLGPVVKMGPFVPPLDPGTVPGKPGQLMITEVYCEDCVVNVQCVEPCTVSMSEVPEE